MKNGKKIFFFIALGIVSAALWVGSFLLQIFTFPLLENDALFLFIFYFRIISFCLTFLSFFAAYMFFVAQWDFGEVFFKKINGLSIGAATLRIIFGFIADGYLLTDETQSRLFVMIIILSLLNVGTFLWSLALAVQKKKLTVLFLLNALISAYSLSWLVTLLSLVGIGLGPPS